jgi:hypothetical protein
MAKIQDNKYHGLLCLEDIKSGKNKRTIITMVITNVSILWFYTI